MSFVHTLLPHPSPRPTAADGSGRVGTTHALTPRASILPASGVSGGGGISAKINDRKSGPQRRIRPLCERPDRAREQNTEQARRPLPAPAPFRRACGPDPTHRSPNVSCEKTPPRNGGGLRRGSWSRWHGGVSLRGGGACRAMKGSREKSWNSFCTTMWCAMRDKRFTAA